jgi:hypothetical protein
MANLSEDLINDRLIAGSVAGIVNNVNSVAAGSGGSSGSSSGGGVNIIADNKKTVKFLNRSSLSGGVNLREKEQISSSGPSSGDDDNDDFENSPNMRYANRSTSKAVAGGASVASSLNQASSNHQQPPGSSHTRKSKVKNFCSSLII